MRACSARCGALEASEQAHSWRGRRPPFASSCLRSKNSSRPTARCRRRATVDLARSVLLCRCRRMFSRRRKVRQAVEPATFFVCVCVTPTTTKLKRALGLLLTLQPPPSSSSAVCEEGKDVPEHRDFITLCFDVLTRD